MALSILTNIASLEAQNNLNTTQSALENSIERLSSGMRINKASDDAAGLAISSKLSSEIRGLAQAARNGNDGISMLQTAEGAMGNINSLLTRMRELAVESANGGTLGTTERQSLNTEYQDLLSEINRLVAVTAYNGQNLIDGSLSAGTTLQVGAFNTANDRISVTISSSDATTIGVSGSDVLSVSTSQAAIQQIDAAIDTVASTRAGIGAAENRLTSAIASTQNEYINLSAANSRILDVDVAAETSSLTRSQILLQAGVSVLAQANQIPQAALQLLRG